MENLRLHGSRVFVKIPQAKIQSKWDHRGTKGILLKYTKVGYCILVNNNVIDARHVEFIEENIKCIGFQDDTDNNSVPVNESPNPDENENSDDKSEQDYEECHRKSLNPRKS